MSVEFKDYSIQVKDVIKDIAIAWLYEASGEIESQTKKNSKVKTGQTKGSYSYKVDEDNLVGYIGSSYQNAIWEELGTGEYALNGDGRKGGWFYKDEKGNGYFTRGKKPRRPFYNAYIALKSTLISSCQERFKDMK